MNRILWSTVVFAVDGGLHISTPHTKWDIFLYVYFCMFIFTYMFETSIAGTLMGNPINPCLLNRDASFGLWQLGCYWRVTLHLKCRIKTRSVAMRQDLRAELRRQKIPLVWRVLCHGATTRKSHVSSPST
jgi:hypothetical protein